MRRDTNPDSSDLDFYAADLIAKFLDYLVINSDSPNTIRAYKADLYGWLKEQDKTYLTMFELEVSFAKYLNNFSTLYSASTVKRKLACFKSFGKWLGSSKFLAQYNAPYTPPGVAHPIEEGVEGILRMIDVANRPQDKALVVLSGLMGLRVSEVRAVRPSDIDESRMELRVYGKGRKQRVVPVSDYAYTGLLPRLLQCWSHNTYLVPATDRCVRRMFTVLGIKAGLANPVSTHDGRMTFGSAAYYKSNGDIRAVQELLGHSSSQTTEVYTAVPMEKMRRAAEIVPTIGE